MIIGFHLENLTFRGTTNAVKDYAYFNQTLLDNTSIFFYKKGLMDIAYDENGLKKHEIFQSFKNGYDVIEYTDIDDLDKKSRQYGCDYFYFLKAGFNDGIVLKNTKSLIHCVFNYYQPHGYRYAYVSEWLANQNNSDFIPHIVNLPRIPQRRILDIPTDKLVIGRYGGYDQFDISFVYNIIKFVVDNDPDIYFVFVNTRPFIGQPHPQIKFLDAIIDPQEKTDFICSCDAMLHARSDGESFGLSIMEFLFHNKPVLSFGKGRDKHNVQQLNRYGLIYNNEYELLQAIFKLKNKLYKDRYCSIAEQFSPSIVMDKFNKVFLEN